MVQPPSKDLVHAFIQSHISSVAQLEILLLLQTNAKQHWPAAKVAQELRADVAGTEQQLTLLVNHQLVRRDDAGHYFYGPATPELEAGVVAVAQAYLIRRVAVIEMIYTREPDNLRAFSDAFRLRKEPPNGLSS